MALGRVVPPCGIHRDEPDVEVETRGAFCSGRGTAEPCIKDRKNPIKDRKNPIKDRKNPIKWRKLSCRTFKGNQTRLHLFALANWRKTPPRAASNGCTFTCEGV